MASTPDPLLRVELQAAGENNNAWGAPKLNLALTDLAFAIAGRTAFALSGSKTLTANNYTADEARSMMLDVTSGTGGTVTVPAVSHVYMVRNGTSGTVTLTVGSGATAAVATGNIGWVMVTGTDCYLVTTATATAASWTTPRDFSFTGDATGTLLSVDGSANKSAALTVANAAITLAKMANLASNGLIGNNTGGSSVPLLLTVAQVTAMLSAMVGDTGSGGTKGLVPAPAAGDAAKVLSGAGTWVTNGGVSISGTSSGWEISIGTLRVKGGLASPGSAHPTILFSNAFPTAALGVLCGAINTGSDTDLLDHSVRLANSDGTLTTSGFGVYCSAEDQANDVFKSATNVQFWWIAVGY